MNDVTHTSHVSEEGDTYIVGGRDAPGAGYWPWQLSLHVFFKHKEYLLLYFFKLLFVAVFLVFE